jgi:F-type H+-transporting ATPase subunit b
MGHREKNLSGERSPRSNHSLRNQRNRNLSSTTPIGFAGFATASLLALVVVLAATPALASGALVLIPDVFGMLPVMLIAFVLLIFPLNALLFQPIFRALDARAERIAGARERSEQLQREADSVLERYETAIREARGDSEVSRQAKLETAREEQLELTAAARGEAERELESARGEMNQSIEEARASLRANAEGLATAAAERVLGRAL